MARQKQISITYIGITALLAMLFSTYAAALPPDDKKGDPNRVITGTVVNDKEQPISGAVVYMKNTRNLAVKSYITDGKGSFRFTGLSPNADFEIYAESNGKRSATKTFSVFDSRKQVDFTLKIDK
jgi:Carboxypeptidase regulatory-like domain